MSFFNETSSKPQEVSGDRGVEVLEDSTERIRLQLPGRMQEIAEGEPSVPIRVDILLPQEMSQGAPQEVVISLHGQGADAAFDEDIAEALREHGAIVIAPTSSRRTEFNPVENPDFAAWMADSFAGKGFDDEVEDFGRGVDAARQALRKQLGGSVDVRVTVLGYSLGGTMAPVVAERYPEAVDHLVLVAPSLEGLDHPEEPLAGEGRPSREQVLTATHRIGAAVIRGDNDPFIPLEDAQAYAGTGGRVITLPDAGHTFGKIPDLLGDSENMRTQLADLIVTAVPLKGVGLSRNG